MSLKFSSPIPHSNPSRTSDASSLKRRSEAILPSQLTTPSRIKRARALIRDGVVSWEGNIASLRRFKDDASEVREGFECGIGLENFNDIKLSDQIECYMIERVAATESEL